MKFVGKLNAKDDKIAELEKMPEEVKASSKKAIADERSACDLRVYNIGKVARAGIDEMVEAYVSVQPSALSEVMAQLQKCPLLKGEMRSLRAIYFRQPLPILTKQCLLNLMNNYFCV